MTSTTLKNYYRLTKPGIIYGNALAALAGFLLASQGNVNGALLLAMLGGIALVVASACVFNNYIDQDIDKKMARTQKRALVTGTISEKNALVYATTLGIIGFAILVSFTNAVTVLLGLMALIVYVIIYGFFKRRSVHGTVVGSIAGAVPPAAGYTAVTGQFDLGALLLFLILVCWQMPHFYAIAIYRHKEYATAGIPVLPVKHGIQATKIQILVYISAFMVAIVGLAVGHYAGYTYLIVMLALGSAWLGRAVQGFWVNDELRWARGIFKFSMIVLLGFCFTLSIDAWVP